MVLDILFNNLFGPLVSSSVQTTSNVQNTTIDPVATGSLFQWDADGGAEWLAKAYANPTEPSPWEFNFNQQFEFARGDGKSISTTDIRRAYEEQAREIIKPNIDKAVPTHELPPLPGRNLGNAPPLPGRNPGNTPPLPERNPVDRVSDWNPPADQPWLITGDLNPAWAEANLDVLEEGAGRGSGTPTDVVPGQQIPERAPPLPGSTYVYPYDPNDIANDRNRPLLPNRASVPIDADQKSKMAGVNSNLQGKFAELQNATGLRFNINSGHRSSTKNASVGGAKRSQHLTGNALDIDVSKLSHNQRIEVIKTASALGVKGIGVYKNSLHIDLGGRRSWGPNFKSSSVPGWARGAIKGHLGNKWVSHFSQKAALGGPTGTVQIEQGGRINQQSFFKTAVNEIRNSKLNGFKPKDGAQYGIETGAPEEWARFYTMLLRQESGGRIARTNRDGSLQRFGSTPKGERSFGPLQFNIGEYGLKSWADVNNPHRNIQALIKVGERFTLRSGVIRGGHRGYDAYFGSVRRPNEVLRHWNSVAGLQ